jgi:hypothetical protein
MKGKKTVNWFYTAVLKAKINLELGAYLPAPSADLRRLGVL